MLNSSEATCWKILKLNMLYRVFGNWEQIFQLVILQQKIERTLHINTGKNVDPKGARAS